MTLGNIEKIIENPNWFSALGTYKPKNHQVALRDLHAWDDEVFSSSIDDETALIAGQMDWLPSSRDEADPIHGQLLINGLKDKENVREIIFDFYKNALRSLRDINREKLKSGPHDYSESAIGAALFCVRMASMEVLSGNLGFWCDALDLYANGFWPCGLLPDKTLVVY